MGTIIQSLIDYANSFTSDKKTEVQGWIETVAAKKLAAGEAKVEDVEHILDYLMSSSSPKRLKKMSYEQADLGTKKWVQSNKKKGRNLSDGNDDIELELELGGGFRIVKLMTDTAYKREGTLMSHCLGGYEVDCNTSIYSLRDSKNMPHATIEVEKSDDEIRQVKGKGNGKISTKYIDFLLSFCEHIGRPIRPSEMSNLGYTRIHNDHFEFAKSIARNSEKVIKIKDVAYVAKR